MGVHAAARSIPAFRDLVYLWPASRHGEPGEYAAG
jgi:hypothetical protein